MRLQFFILKKKIVEQSISEEHEVRSVLHVKQESRWSNMYQDYIRQMAHSVDLQH
jgi:hypothetical protein